MLETGEGTGGSERDRVGEDRTPEEGFASPFFSFLFFFLFVFLIFEVGLWELGLCEREVGVQVGHWAASSTQTSSALALPSPVFCLKLGLPFAC